MRAGDHVAEGAEIICGEPLLHGGENPSDFAAAAADLSVGEHIFGFGHARDGNLAALEAVDILSVFFGSDKFVVATADELQQVGEELSDIGGADVMFEVQVTNATAKINPEILFIENAEIFACAPQQHQAIVVERRCLNGLAQKLAHTLLHLGGGIHGVGEGEDLVGAGITFSDQALDAVGEYRSFSSAGTGYDQHGAVNVFDGFALSLVRSELGTGTGLREWHCRSAYHLKG